MNIQKLLVVVAIAALPLQQAAAVPISGLLNTGASFSAGQQDTNYALTKSGGGGPAIGAFGYEWSGSGFPAPHWMANNASSQWLTPLANAGQTFDAGSSGIYTWSLTFDLTGFAASTASFSGQWATDNTGVAKLNGTTLANPSGGFGSWSSFSSSGGTFLAGLNTLDFIVTNSQQNGGNPTGLRVEFLSSDVRASVPEPTTLGILAIGLAGIGFSRRKRLS